MSTLKVEVCSIDDIRPHPNADRLDLATVKGWQCVVSKDTYKKGDLCVYIPIDSVLPHEVEATIFPPDSKVKLNKSRVKTIKLRGAISQGLVVPPSLLSISNPKEGQDYSTSLGITKYEPPVNLSPQKNCLTVSKKQLNPHFRKYTSIENFKNYHKLFEDGEQVVITEKIHGTNFRAGWVPTVVNTWWKKALKLFGILPKYEFVYGSHNVQLQNKLLYTGYYDTNVYAQAVHKYCLKQAIPEGFVMYGEIYGDGIQKGYSYGCQPNERRLLLFDIMKDGEYLDWSGLVAFNQIYTQLEVAPVLYQGPFNEAHAKLLATGDSVLSPEQKVREGVVIKPLKESKTYMGRKVLKLINDEYLLRDNTDFH